MKKHVDRCLLLTLVVFLISYGISFSQEFHTEERIWSDYTCPEDTHTYDYASIIVFCRGDDPNSCPVGAFFGKNHPVWPESISWSHTLPPELLVPPCEITRAWLWINAKAVNNEDNSISIQGTSGWAPLNHLVHDNSAYDLTGTSEEGFWNQGFIDVLVWAGSERLVRVDVAKLLLDYDCETSEVEENGSSSAVQAFTLSQNYPNPFNPETKISFTLPERMPISLAVYNVFGQKVRRLINAILPAGSYTLIWDGTGNEGEKLASGVYFCRLQAGDRNSVSKMILLK